MFIHQVPSMTTQPTSESYQSCITTHDNRILHKHTVWVTVINGNLVYFNQRPQHLHSVEYVPIITHYHLIYAIGRILLLNEFDH